MKNIKTSVFSAMIILTIMYQGSVLTQPAGTAMVQELDKVLDKHLPILTKLLKSLSDKSVDAAKIVGIDAASALAKGAFDASKVAGVDAAGELAKGAVQTADKFSAVGHGMVNVAGVVAAVYSVTQLYPIGKEIASYVCPSEEQKILDAERLEIAQHRLDLLHAGKSFRQCLVENRLNSDRGISGLPSVCENAAELFASLGGVNEVKQMMEYINKFRK